MSSCVAKADRRAASTSNDVWVMDFVHDQLATGQKIRVLTVVDTFSRFSPALDPRGTVMSGRRSLIKGYFWLCAGRGCGHVFGLSRGE